MELAYYPSPVSKLPMWRGLAALAEVPSRSIGYMFGLPFAAAVDQEYAEERLAKSVLTMSREERRRRVTEVSRLHHRARIAATAALEAGATHLGIWNGQGGRRRVLVDAARQAGLRTLFSELAPISNHITLDPRGVNGGGMVPTDPGYFRQWSAAHPDQGLLDNWRRRLVARAGVKRGNQGQIGNAPFVFVPLQVSGDTQIHALGGWIHGIPQFIDEVAQAAEHLPAGWRVIFREHPSDKHGNAEQLSRLLGPRVAVDNETDTFDLVRRSQGVVTVNSSVGLQALLLERAVLVLGRANYAVEGMVRTAGNSAALAEAFAAACNWQFAAELTNSFLRFLAEEYYVPWPATDETARMRVATLVRNRLAGRLTDWTP